MFELKSGLTDETYKYTYGSRNKWLGPFAETKEFKAICGQNDWAVVQLLLYAEDEMMVGLGNAPYFSENGPVNTVRIAVDIPGIKDEDITVKLVGLIEDDDRQLKSDILLNQEFIYVESRKVQAIWVEVQTGQDTNPGNYQAEIKVFGHKMFADEKLMETLYFKFEVKAVVLKRLKESSFYLDLWQHNSNIARKYNVRLWSDEHFAIIDNYVESLAELGQKAVTAVVSEIPWSGQNASYDNIFSGNLFEYNMVRVALNKDGNWEYDFSALNRYINLCFKYGIDQEIELFGLINIWLQEDVGYGRVIEDYDDGIRIRYYDEVDHCYKYIKEKKDLDSYIKALNDNLMKNNWGDKVRVMADEPADLDKFKKRLTELRNIAPSFKFKVAINHLEFMEEDLPGVVDYVPILDCVCADFQQTRRLKEYLFGKFLFYVCCHPDKPNTFISSPLIESRIIPWLTWQLGLDGFLRWNYTVWPAEPLKTLSYHFPGWKAGDTNFVYPGKDGTPLLSLRYKNLQRGIRDYEIFQMVSSRSDKKQELSSKVEKVFYWDDVADLLPAARKQATELYSLTYTDYEKIIAEILDILATE